MKALVRNHPVVAYFALTFTISWGGVLLVTGGPAGMTAAKALAVALFVIVDGLAAPEASSWRC